MRFPTDASLPIVDPMTSCDDLFVLPGRNDAIVGQSFPCTAVSSPLRVSGPAGPS
jgi:hypothetical protein